MISEAGKRHSWLVWEGVDDAQKTQQIHQLHIVRYFTAPLKDNLIHSLWTSKRCMNRKAICWLSILMVSHNNNSTNKTTGWTTLFRVSPVFKCKAHPTLVDTSQSAWVCSKWASFAFLSGSATSGCVSMWTPPAPQQNWFSGNGTTDNPGIFSNNA